MSKFRHGDFVNVLTEAEIKGPYVVDKVDDNGRVTLVGMDEPRAVAELAEWDEPVHTDSSGRQTINMAPSWVAILNIVRQLVIGAPQSKAINPILEDMRRPLGQIDFLNACGKAKVARLAQMELVEYVCPDCGSAVGRDANASWSVEDQKWELSGVHDGFWCTECEWEGDPEEKKIVEEPCECGREKSLCKTADNEDDIHGDRE